MIIYWIEFIKILLPGLFFMSVSALPLALSTIAAARHRQNGNKAFYLRILWGSTAAGVLSVSLLFGSLFGKELSGSSTAALIFIFVPIYSTMALGIGYGLGAFVHRKRTQTTESRPHLTGI